MTLMTQELPSISITDADMSTQEISPLFFLNLVL